jgi:hypothetical protein
MWKRVQHGGITPLQRSGHSSIIFRGEIYIYGGILEDRGFRGVKKEEMLIYDIGKIVY